MNEEKDNDARCDGTNSMKNEPTIKDILIKCNTQQELEKAFEKFSNEIEKKKSAIDKLPDAQNKESEIIDKAIIWY